MIIFRDMAIDQAYMVYLIRNPKLASANSPNA